MDFISKVKLSPNGNFYYIKDNTSLPVISGTQNAATGSWTGIAPFGELVDGQKIIYYLPYAGNGNATLNLTLADGTTTTGAVNCYYSGSNRLTTHYGASSFILMVYRKDLTWNGGTTKYTGWWVISDYNTDNNNFTLLSEVLVKAGTAGITPYTLVMRTGTDTYESIVTATNAGTGTNHTVNTVGFYLDTILRNEANATVTNGNVTGNWRFRTHCNIDFRYSCNCGTTLTARKPVYLVGTFTNGKFYLDTTKWYSQDLPITKDDKIYIYLGIAYNTYCITLENAHPMYWYINGHAELYSPIYSLSSDEHLSGTLPFSKGGTGEITGVNAANSLLNQLTTGNSDPQDNDYFISQYAGGAQSTFHRRPVSKLWNYIKTKIQSVFNKTLTFKDNSNNTIATYKPDTAATLNFGTGISITGDSTKDTATISLASGVVTAGTKGATADVTGTEGTTIKVPKITVDTYGRVTSLSEYTLTNKNTTYSAGVGLTLSSNTFKAKLKSETALTNDSTASGNTANRTYSVAIDKSGYLAVNVPWADTNNKVTQTDTSTDANYRVLLSKTDNNTETTDTVGKSEKLIFNPNTGNLTANSISAITSASTLHANSTFSLSTNTKITVNENSLIQSPIPKYLWHDLFAFCRKGPPTYYTTTDNTNWTQATLDKSLFDQHENQSINIISATGKTGSRWLWSNSSFSYSSGKWLVLGISYTSPSPEITIVFETSSDNITWNTRFTKTHTEVSRPIWCFLSNYGNNRYLRLTITKDASNTTGTLCLNSIKLLSSRWGDQGAGSEYEFPYNWSNGDITSIDAGNCDFGSTSNYWKNGYFTNINGVAVGSSPAFTDTWRNIQVNGTEKLGTGTGTGVANFKNGTGITVSYDSGIIHSLSTITKNNTTSTASPAHGGTFTAIDSVTYDNYGRVTGVNTKTVTLPSDNNTDTLVNQSVTTTSNWRKIVVGHQDNASYGATVETRTNIVYVSNNLEFQPSTGTVKTNHVKSTDFTINEKVTLQYNSTNDCVDFVFI